MFQRIKSLIPREKPVSAAPSEPEKLGREIVARHYLKGTGIEVGALHNPLKVPNHVKVRFVDRMSDADLRRQYPELATLPLVTVDVIDDGEKLTTFAESSVDFVIANHFLEHSQDPIGTIKNMMRVLKPGGVLYLAVPDKRYTFDKDRPITTLQHLLDDHNNGPQATRMTHFHEYAKFVSLAREDGFDSEIKRLLDLDYSIHFHVWDKTAFTAFLNTMADSIGYDLEFNMQNDHEILNILRKRNS